MSALLDRGVVRPVVIACRAEGCMLTLGGAVVGIRRAPMDAAHIADVQRALATAAGAGSEKRVMLTTYRLSPDFPVEVAHTTGAEQYVAALRDIDRVVAAYAMVIELGGVRAAGLRAITRVVWPLARPRAALGTFDRLTDAVAWLAPRAQVVGALDEPAEYVRLYRMADQMLEDLDAESRAG